MKLLTAQEARELTELSNMSEIYELIADRAQSGFYTVSITDVTDAEFKQLKKDGFRVFNFDGTIEFSRYEKGVIEDYADFIIDWEV